VLDSGALTALAARKEAVRVYVARELRSGANVVVPSVVLAESTSGTASDANLNRIVRKHFIQTIDEGLARAAGRLRYACRVRRAGTIDAIVVAVADMAPGSIILTSDPKDIRTLVEQRRVSRVLAM
jgi:hypothetical protein